MIVRRFAAVGALTFAALSIPALAQAAPIVPAQAVLAANEFPLGSTGYKTDDATIDFNGDESANTACDRAVRDAVKSISGVKAVSAEVLRGTTKIESGVVGRAYTARVAEIDVTCDADSSGNARPQKLAAPPDLARYRTHITTYRGSSIDSWVDVRGVTVSVQAHGTDGTPVDADAFWQTLRAQVAKVERQP
ncbi:hypothetical protein TSST111916_04405 [Tsukamurella strandjordii]|uniref:hypothetical protein n=1 Tax=Tsukamurella TaxID=2060 RepID=UPI001C7CB630|nr:hypothetical protein [Tsukamurella sp. TY48]GIZ99189.1 hypothetical protein TTY48_38010 [Tsukamurella sp. TY48]